MKPVAAPRLVSFEPPGSKGKSSFGFQLPLNGIRPNYRSESPLLPVSGYVFSLRETQSDFSEQHRWKRGDDLDADELGHRVCLG